LDQHDWHLNPEQLPKRLDLDLPEETYEKLQQLSSRTGLSIEELASNFLSQVAFNDAAHPEA